MKLRLLLCSLVIGLAGCATTSGNAPTVSQSGFDSARVVDISPHGNACTSMICTAIGFQWSSKTPDAAIMTVSLVNDIKGITGASLSIDGVVTRLQPISGITNFSRIGSLLKESRQTFLVQVSTLRGITTSKKTWIRLFTTDGSVEDAVIDGETDSKAYHALRRFLAVVDQSPVAAK